MLESTRHLSAFGVLNARPNHGNNRSDRNTLHSLGGRFSAALHSAQDPRTPASARGASSFTTERSRSNSVTSRAHQLLASVAPAHRDDDAGGRNLLEIPMDQPVPLPTVSAAAPPYAGPQDKRDGWSYAAGKLTSSGAPSIVRLTTPIANQWDYTGDAAFNPYFTTPSNPMRDGFVSGFSQWFEGNHIGGVTDAEISPRYSATPEGAQEALRLAQHYDPGATLGSSRFGASGGPWLASKDTREVVLSNGTHVNAGLLLGSYYNQGQGVTSRSDQMLQLTVKG